MQQVYTKIAEAKQTVKLLVLLNKTGLSSKIHRTKKEWYNTHNRMLIIKKKQKIPVGTVAEWAFKAKFENFEAVGQNKF